MKKHLLILLLSSILPAFSFAATGPTVTTSTRYARGATMAFGRMTRMANGLPIVKRGFCYATHDNPTLEDSVTTTLLPADGSVTGEIYWLQNLTPSTCYYMRAFATDKNGNTGFGDVVRFYTLPKASIHYTIREDANNQDAVNRIRAAVENAYYYWTNLTSMQGFYPNVGYNAGTPTADCSYGGYVRVGSNQSYQRTGTILHEWLHGVGVGTTETWYNNPDMRTNTSRGAWLGERATEIVRFLANDNTSVLNGDNQHLWPYGVNGAHEDDGKATLYIANSLVCQALGEDGLPLTSSMGFATPYDAFDCQSTVNYYLRSEDANHGLYSSFLKEEKGGALKWVAMSTKDATANDSVAWKFAYNPVNCYYTIQNVATGHYIIYSSGFSARHTDPTAAYAQIQLLRGRVASVDGIDNHGYFLAYNNHTMTAPVLEASDNGATTAGEFTFSNAATSRRWLILTADEAQKVENLGKKNLDNDLNDLLSNIEKVVATPHREDVSGTDAKMTSDLADIKSEAESATDVATIENLKTRAYSALNTFLTGVTAASEDNPFDLTFLITNASADNSEGWSEAGTVNYKSTEFYQKTFDFNQTIKRDFPKGHYALHVQAFQRPGSTSSSYTAWSAKPATSPVTTEIYMGLGTASTFIGQKVKNIWDDAQSTKVGVGDEKSQGGLYVPNTMQSAGAYFDKGLYDNVRSQRFPLSITANRGLKVGIRCTNAPSNYWTIFRNFRLYFYGKDVIPTGITAPKTSVKSADTFNVYNISGQLVRSNARDLNGLPHGLYIVNGKKVIK